MNRIYILTVLIFIAISADAQEFTTTYSKATFYADRFNHRRTSNGEIFNMDSLTAASKELPFGTILRVTNLLNDKSVIVRVNDRCPGYNGRTLDLSKAAAKRIEMLKQGVAGVKVENLGIVQNDRLSTFVASKVIKKVPETILPSLPSDATSFAVQIGTFKVKSNVDKLTAILTVNGFKNNKVKTQCKNDETLYKVTVGPYSTINEAQTALKKLRKQNFGGQLIKGDSYTAI
jgi:rare lipoprotein A